MPLASKGDAVRVKGNREKKKFGDVVWVRWATGWSP